MDEAPQRVALTAALGRARIGAHGSARGGFRVRAQRVGARLPYCAVPLNPHAPAPVVIDRGARRLIAQLHLISPQRGQA